MRKGIKKIFTVFALILLITVAKSQTVALMQVNGVLRNLNDTFKICVGNNLTYQSISTGVSTTNWVFQGGTPGTAANPGPFLVTYNTAGVFETKLLIVNGPDRDSTFVYVDVSNTKPTMDFTFTPNNVCGGTPIMFTSNVTSGIAPLTFGWNWGDGSATSTSQNDIHSFVAQGPPYPGTRIFNVKHYATTSYGCIDSITKPVSFRTTPHDSIVRGNTMIQFSIFNGFPTFSTCVNASSYTFSFINQSLTQAGNTGYHISWGDGSPDTTFTTWPTPTLLNHTFPLGNSVMTVTTSGVDGCNTIKRYNVFLGSNPSVGLSSPGNTSACAPVSFTFGISGTASNPPGTTYQFVVNDGSPPVNFAHPPPSSYTHNFTNSSCGTTSNFGGMPFPNSFTATITATNPCGSTPSGVASVYISSRPSANILVSPSNVICANTPLSFINQTSSGSYINPGNATNCVVAGNQVWAISPSTGFTLNSGTLGNTFGSTNTVLWQNGSNVINVSFSNPGNYIIKLYAANDCGIDSTIRTVCVRTPPTASFNMSADSSCGPLEVDFTNTSPTISACVGNVATWAVSYTDPLNCSTNTTSPFAFTGGSTNTSISPKITFSRPGRYIITLNMRANTPANICPIAAVSDTFWVKERPKVTINPIASICANSTINSSAMVTNCYATQTPTYLWTFTNGTPNTSTATTPSGILYTMVGTQPVQLAVTNECGTTTANTNVVITNPPVANAGVDREICSSQTTSIGVPAVGGVTYSWSPNTGLSNANIANPNVTLTYNGANVDTVYIYALIANLSANCFARDTVLVRVKKGVNLTLLPASAAICSGDSVQLIVSGADTYTWSPATNITSTTEDTVKVFPTINTTYTVQGNIVSGCSATRNITVQVTPRPTAAAGVDKEICSGLSTTIGSSGVAGVTYNWAPSTGLNNANIAVPTVTLLYNGINPDTTYQYVLTASRGVGCTATDTVNVTVKKGVALILNPTTASICSGDSVMLTVTGANAYTWSPAIGLNVNNRDTVIAKPTSTTTYNILGNATNGCQATGSITVAVQPLPNTNAGLDTLVCNSSNAVQLTGSPAGGIWSGNANVNAAGQFNAAASGLGTFQLFYNATLNGCSKLDSMLVTVVAPVIPSAGNDTTVCQNTGLFIIQGNPSSGVWSGSALVNPAGVFNPTAAGTYNLVYTYGQGTCLRTDNKQIIVQPILTNNNISSNQTICINTVPTILTGTNVVGGNGTYTYQWQQSSNGVTYTNIGTATGTSYQPPALTADTYYKRIVNSSTCKADTSAAILITVKLDAIAQFTASQYIDCAPFIINNNILNTTILPAQNGTYNWYVNGGSIGSNTTGLFPGYTINTPGDTITIRLIVQSQFGCVPDTIERGFKTIVQPAPDFSKNSNGGCAPIPITFTNNTPNVNSFNYIWNFGNGQTSTLANPLPVVYNVGPTFNDTTYTIRMGAFNGCDTIYQTTTVAIKSKPKAIFAPVQVTGCSPFLAKFVNLSLGMRMRFYWDFGDGGRDTTNTKDTVFHMYNTGIRDTFNVRLIAENECGRDTVIYNIIVDPRTLELDFNFNATDRYGCLPHTVRFFNNSVGGNNFIWDFGDGSSLTTFNNVDTVTHTYTIAGNFVIRLRGRNDCTDTTGQEILTTYSKPLVSFIGNPTNLCVGETIQLTNTSEPGLSITWRFGDGTNSTANNPTKAYNAAGNYIITLFGSKVQASGLICTDSFKIPVTVFATRPGELFTIDTLSTCYPYTVKLKKIIPIGGITTWNFGNGTTAVGDSATVVYDTVGTFNIIMTTTATGGCLYTDSVRVVVNGPSGVFNYLGGVLCTSGTVNFNVVSNGANQFIFNFGDGATQTSNIGNTSYTYNTPGFYVPFVTIKNGTCEKILKTNDTIKVDRVVPKFGFLITNQCGNTRVQLIDSSNAFSGIQSYNWSLGSGQNSTLQNPVANFNASGTYTFKLVVTSRFGCIDSISKTVFIQVNQNPSVTISAPSANSCVNAPYALLANINSIDPVTSIQWFVSNGATASGLNPSFVFSTPGPYQIKVVVATQFGCKDSAILNLTVFPLFSIVKTADTRICLGQSTNLAVTGGVLYNWSPSNGLSCTSCPNPVASPIINTLYYVTVTNGNGCVIKDSITVTVTQPFAMNLDPLRDTICIGESVQMNAAGATTYAWSPAAGVSNITIPNPVVAPTNTTTYMVVGSDAFNCFSDTIFSTIVVGQPAAINLGADKLVATGSTVNLNAALVNGPYNSFNWLPTTNLSCTNCPNPQAIIRNAITYTLQGTTIYGCTASDTITINVFCEKGQVYLPNGFKPTGSNKYMVRGQGIKNIKLFKIFNRAGQVVFEKNNFQPNDLTYGWDGKLNGQLSAPDVYVYYCVVECDNGTPYEYKGNITLIR